MKKGIVFFVRVNLSSGFICLILSKIIVKRNSAFLLFSICLNFVISYLFPFRYGLMYLILYLFNFLYLFNLLPDKFDTPADPTEVVVDEKASLCLIVDNDNHRILIYSLDGQQPLNEIVPSPFRIIFCTGRS